jgi:hypothetical protein
MANAKINGFQIVGTSKATGTPIWQSLDAALTLAKSGDSWNACDSDGMAVATGKSAKALARGLRSASKASKAKQSKASKAPKASKAKAPKAPKASKAKAPKAPKASKPLASAADLAEFEALLIAKQSKPATSKATATIRGTVATVKAPSAGKVRRFLSSIEPKQTIAVHSVEGYAAAIAERSGGKAQRLGVVFCRVAGPSNVIRVYPGKGGLIEISTSEDGFIACNADRKARQTVGAPHVWYLRQL